MEFAIIGLIVSLMALFLRDSCLPRDFELCSCRFRMCLGLPLSANLVAVLGFHGLANGSGTPNGDQRAILEVLSLLSAGAVAGFWGIEYGEAHCDETHLLNIISALFVILFYSLFIAICFYIGKSTEMQKTPGASWVVPGIMALLLEINAVIDIWDYRKPRKLRTIRRDPKGSGIPRALS
jgi:hypothetical protein